MAQNKSKPEKPKIEIKTRKPERKGIFDNIGLDRKQDDEHPIREILNFPVNSDLDSQKNKTLDSQKNNDQIAKLDNIGNPDALLLDSQHQNTGYPTNLILDSQSQKIGNPNDEDLDILIAKDTSRISKEKPILDSKISKSKKADIQKQEKKSDWQKYDGKRKIKGIFLRTNEEITIKFKQFCIANNWDYSQGTELAWNKLMSDLDSQKAESLDSLIALDDRRMKIMFKSKPFIINLYLRYNSIFNELSGSGSKKWNARWTPRDDEAGVRYNDISPMIVELGIIQTQIQKGIKTSQIQTFKYYVDEIEKVLTSGVADETLSTILNYHRQIWMNQTSREIDLKFLDATDSHICESVVENEKIKGDNEFAPAMNKQSISRTDFVRLLNLGFLVDPIK